MQGKTLIKPVLTEYKNELSGVRQKVCDFTFPTKSGELSLKTTLDKGYFDKFHTKIKSGTDEIASDCFSVNSQNGCLEDFFMLVVNSERGKKIGELLRLSSIIELIENKLQTLLLFSAEKAVYFHSKYGFEPFITRKDELLKVLSSIANDKSPETKELYLKAKILIEQINPLSIEEYKSNFLNQCNKLISEYIEIGLHTGYEKHPFLHGMQMKLAKDKLLSPDLRDKYNKAFLSHQIDYQI